MALTKELEALIAELDKVDAVGAKELRANMEKYPTLQTKLHEGVLRQSDYDKFLNDNKTKIKDGETMRKWSDDAVPEYNRMKSAHDDLTAKVTKAEADLAAEIAKKSLAAATVSSEEGKGVDPEKLAEAVKARLAGEIPTKTELNALIVEETKKAENTFLNETFPRAAQWQSEWTDAQLMHFKENNNELLDSVKFSAFMKENKIGSPREAYEKFMEPVRRQKDIEVAATKRADEILAERRKATGGDDLPGTSGGLRGPLQIRFETKAKEDPLFSSDAALGDGSMASSAAQELVAEGKV